MALRKFTPLLISLLILALVALSVITVKWLGVSITYSATASMPKGFYLIQPAHTLQRYDIVTFLPPTTARQFIQTHHWGPQSGVVLKYVYAMPGDYVCIKNAAVWINNYKVAAVVSEYQPGKLLPQARFCGTLGDDEYLLMSTHSARSFDGRYFGPVKRAAIIGKAVKL